MSSWLVPFPGNAALTLYAAPHAGAGASVYRPWTPGLTAHARVVGLQPPGREARYQEAHAEDVQALGAQAAAAIAAHAPGPFMVFGHSLGALVAFETALALEALGRPATRLIVSGSRAPQLPRAGGPRLTDEQLLARLHELGGTPQELLRDPELLAVFFPALRGDLFLASHYQLRGEPVLRTPLVAMGGLADAEVPQADLLAWRARTAGAFELHMFEGGHFFLHERREDTLALLRRLAEA